MTENPVTAEFNAAAERFQKELKESKADEVLAALRDAAQDVADSGAQVSLEVRPRLEGSAETPSVRVFANAVLTVDGFVVNWLLWTELKSRERDWVNATLLAATAGGNEIARFSLENAGYNRSDTWLPMDLRGKASLKDALVAVIAQARAEHDILGGYNVGVQPSSLQKPYIAGLKARPPEKP